MRTADGKLPFTSLDKLEDSEVSFGQRGGLAPCLGRPCVFETNVALLPTTISHTCERAQDMLDLEDQNLRTLGDSKMHNCLIHHHRPLMGNQILHSAAF